MPRGVYLRTAEGRANIAAARRGTTLSDETKAKISQQSRRLGKDPEWRKRVSECTKKRMHDDDVRPKHLAALTCVFDKAYNHHNFRGGNGEEPNKNMRDFAEILCPNGFEMNTVIIPLPEGSYYRLDFAHREAKVDIEIDGSSHRGREERNQKRDRHLRSLGWKVIRIKV